MTLSTSEAAMLCPNCHGRHLITSMRGVRPCPECGGAGEIHCCEGMQSQAGEIDGAFADSFPSLAYEPEPASQAIG